MFLDYLHLKYVFVLFWDVIEVIIQQSSNSSIYRHSALGCSIAPHGVDTRNYVRAIFVLQKQDRSMSMRIYVASKNCYFP